MVWTLTTSQAILFKAGANFNSTAGTSGSLMALISDLAEAAVFRDSEYDWVANYASVITNFRSALSDAASDIGAKFLIEHDMSGFTNNGEAVTMVNILIDNYGKGIQRLKDINVRTKAGVS